MASPARVRAWSVSSVATWTARALFGLFGLLGVGATVYFTFFAPIGEGGVSGSVDWLVAVWSVSMAVGYLYVAVRLGDGTRRTLRIAVGLVLAHIVFGLVKLLGYGETESTFFFAVDLLLLVLLAVASRRLPWGRYRSRS